jgi:hypothetical protein
MRNPIPRKNLFLLLAAFVLLGMVWLSLNVWTAPVGLLWHLFHGSFTSFEKRKIHVPWDMWRENSGDGALTLIRWKPAYRILTSPSGVITVLRSRLTIDMSKNYDKIADMNEHPPSGYKFRGLHQFTAAKGTAYCWESVALDSSRVISCWFDKDTMLADFYGSPVYRDEFYKAIATLSGESSRPSP